MGGNVGWEWREPSHCGKMGLLDRKQDGKREEEARDGEDAAGSPHLWGLERGHVPGGGGWRGDSVGVHGMGQWAEEKMGPGTLLNPDYKNSNFVVTFGEFYQEHAQLPLPGSECVFFFLFSLHSDLWHLSPFSLFLCTGDWAQPFPLSLIPGLSYFESITKLRRPDSKS